MTATKPNFLIAGAGKAGTTSLHDYLGQHPEVFMSSFKEPNYFVPNYGYNYRDDISELERILERDLSVWRAGEKFAEPVPSYVGR